MLPVVVTVKEHGKCNEKQQTATLMTVKAKTSLLFTVLKVLYNVCIFHKSDSSTSKAAARSCTLCPDDSRGTLRTIPGMAEWNQAVLCKNTK